MNEFLVELYVSKSNCTAVTDRWARLARVAAELTGEGRNVRLLQAIFVPEDETCFVLVEADTAEDVHETARRASLVCERVVEATVDLTTTAKEI